MGVVFKAFGALYIVALLAMLSSHEPPLRPADTTAAANDIINSHAYVIAANFFNNEDILPQFSEQLVKLADRLGRERVYVSIYESASVDGTKEQLRRLEKTLAVLGIRNSIVVDPDPRWRSMCKDLSPQMMVDMCESAKCTTLKDCKDYIRIPIMAAIRQRALLPVESLRRERLKVQASGGSSDPLLTDPLSIVFINDILLWADDIVELILTRKGEYDMACAMDFELFTMYDLWVARDIGGDLFSDWYPHVREERSVQLMRQSKPFPVYSCWNGAVVIKGDSMWENGIRFRSWSPGEVRSIHPLADTRETFRTHSCPASECTLLCKDLWAASARRIVMNPRVQLYYNWETFRIQRYLIPFVNSFRRVWYALLAPSSRFEVSVPPVEYQARTKYASKSWNRHDLDARGEPIALVDPDASVWDQMVAPMRLRCGIDDENTVKWEKGDEMLDQKAAQLEQRIASEA